MATDIYDVVIIGAGIVGTSIARELSRWKANLLVVESQDDVCAGTTKANAALVHAGYDAQPGSLMAKLNVEGNVRMFEIAEELEVAYEREGSLVVCTSEEGRFSLENLKERGITNGVPDLRIVERKELEEMEPNISDEAICALFAPTAGIIDPFGLTSALAENAAANGVHFRFNSEVRSIMRDSNGIFVLYTSSGSVRAKSVINAAGVYADTIHNMVCADKISIVARKGEFYLLDTTAGQHVNRTIFALPTQMGKGVALMRTVHGNLLVGPTAIDVDDKGATDTTQEGLQDVVQRCSISIKDVPLRETITQFAGLRAHRPEHDFLIEESSVPYFFDCAGIESPGISSAPAIGTMVAEMVSKRMAFEQKSAHEWDGKRKGIVDLNKIDLDTWKELCEEDPLYGRIICRCRRVSEGQIVDAIHRNPGAHTVDGIKHRTCAGMGRCQGGFCMPKVMDILERELGDMNLEKVTKSGPGSEYIVAPVKGLKGGVEA